jgi:hypothetical protein
MPQFTPDQVSFGDLPGYGAFDIGHAREHMQFVQTLAASGIPIPDYDFLTMLTAPATARGSIFESHARTHVALRGVLGISGVDLSVVNLDAQDDFYAWSGAHAQEHALLRQALGIT